MAGDAFQVRIRLDESTEDLILLREADIQGSGYRLEYRADRWRAIYSAMLADGCPWSIADLGISGKELMAQFGLPPSRQLSDLKKHLLEHCVCCPKDNDPERLLRLARDYLGKVRTNC